MTEMYSPSEVQKLLGIDSSTLRKYATLLEGHEYHVHRNNRGHRIYFDKDVHTLHKLMEFIKQEGMTIERSVEAVIAWVSEEYKTGIVTEESLLQYTTDTVTEEIHSQNTTDTGSGERPLYNTTDTVFEESPLQNTTDTIAEESPLQSTTDTVVEKYPIQNTNDQDNKQDCNHDELLEHIEHLEQINVELIKILKEKAVQEAYQEEKINQILKYVERTAQLALERSQMEEAKRQIAAAKQKKWWKWWK